MAGDYLVPVAGWLANHPGDQHQFRELAAELLSGVEHDHQAQLAAVRAAIERLDALGFVVYYQHVVQSVVSTQHRDGLRRIAAGEPLAEVAQSIEHCRPLVIIRIGADQYAAWYRSVLRLPAGASTTGTSGVFGATPDQAQAALRQQARVTAGLDTPPDQVTTRQ